MENLIVLILAFLPFDDVNRTGLRNYIFHIFEVHADRKCLFADLKGLEVTAGAIDFYVIFFLFYDWHIVVVMPKFVLFLNIFRVNSLLSIMKSFTWLSTYCTDGPSIYYPLLKGF